MGPAMPNLAGPRSRSGWSRGGSLHYWLATVRRDGTPHVVPVDGMWLDGGCYFGGDPATVHIRNLRRDGRATCTWKMVNQQSLSKAQRSG